MIHQWIWVIQWYPSFRQTHCGNQSNIIVGQMPDPQLWKRIKEAWCASAARLHSNLANPASPAKNPCFAMFCSVLERIGLDSQHSQANNGIFWEVKGNMQWQSLCCERTSTCSPSDCCRHVNSSDQTAGSSGSSLQQSLRPQYVNSKSTWISMVACQTNEMTTPCASACSHLKQDLVQALWQKQDW